MQYFKLYEEFSLKKHNLYALMGQNLQNYLNQVAKSLAKSRYIDVQFLKELQRLCNDTNVKTINVADIAKLIDSFFKDLLKKIENVKEIAELRNIHTTFIQFMSFLMISFKFDFSKFASFLHNDKWFNSYKITEPKELGNLKNIINQRWLKISNDDSKTKNLLITEMNVENKNWQTAFRDEKVLKFRDLTKYTIKPDEQQEEAENHIIEFNNKLSNEQLEQIEKTDAHAAVTISKLPEIVGFEKDWLKRFDQPGLPDSHKMMKKWFLEAFKNAEDLFKQKLVINSGIRTEEYQKYLTSKGYKTAKKNSPHIQGVAADISIVNLDEQKLIEAFEKAGFTRFGVGKSFLHVDLGDKLNPKIWVPFARWTYTY